METAQKKKRKPKRGQAGNTKIEGYRTFNEYVNNLISQDMQ